MAMARTTVVKRGKEMGQCIDDCLDCHSICLETSMSYCLEKGGKHAEPGHMRLMLDCSEICQVSANFMLRNSNFSTRTCNLCAEICIKCAESCEQFKGDEIMAACAKVCRRCADSCEKMSEMSMAQMSSMAKTSAAGMSAAETSM